MLLLGGQRDAEPDLDGFFQLAKLGNDIAPIRQPFRVALNAIELVFVEAFRGAGQKDGMARGAFCIDELLDLCPMWAVTGAAAQIVKEVDKVAGSVIARSTRILLRQYFSHRCADSPRPSAYAGTSTRFSHCRA